MYTATWSNLCNSYYTIACLIVMLTLLTIFPYYRLFLASRFSLFFQYKSFRYTYVINLFFITWELLVTLLNEHSS